MATGAGGNSQRGPEKTWEKSAPSQIILNSIFAALSAVLLTLVIGDSLPRDLKYLENKLKFAELLFALFSFFLFAMSAEGTTNAYDEKDVRKYVYYLLLYNLGVFFLGAAIATLVGAHFLEHLANVVVAIFCWLSRRWAEIIVLILYSVAFVILQWHWIHDIYWLCFSNDANFGAYLKELQDEAEPERDETLFMRLFYKRRNL